MPIISMWSVIYGNYFPREVDSYWDTKEEAEARVNELSDESRAAGLGSGMWEVEEVRCATKTQPTDKNDGPPN